MITDSFERIRKSSKLEMKNRLQNVDKNYNYKYEIYKKSISESNSNQSLNSDKIHKIESHIEERFVEVKDKIITPSTISTSLIFNKISFSKINCSKFINCKFENIKFKSCTFLLDTFSNCIFNNVVFEECDFGSYDISIFNLNTTIIDTTFKNCNLNKNIFDKVKIQNLKFVLCNLKGVIINDSDIKEIYITDCDCRNFKVVSSSIDFIEFDDNFLTKLNEYTFFDKLKINKKDKTFYESSTRVYKSIFSKFEDNRLLSNAGEYYYLSKQMEYKTFNGFNKIKSKMFHILCGYGERPTYALITSIEVVLIFAIIYMFTGLDTGGHTIDYGIDILKKLPLENLASDFLQSLYFSIVTFTTVGYGDITPIRESVIMSGVEMFIGVTMVGVWTATLARKITR